jgi:hypothetical protein
LPAESAAASAAVLSWVVSLSVVTDASATNVMTNVAPTRSAKSIALAL